MLWKIIDKIQKNILGASIREIREMQDSIKSQLEDIQKINLDNRILVGLVDSKLRSFESNWQIETMSKYEDVSNYKICQHIEKMHKLLAIKSIDEKNGRLIRTGNPSDGGYIMLDKFVEKKVAYSFGICDDVSWDRFMAERGFDVYMYDHTIPALPEENEKFHWHKIGLTGVYDDTHPELHTLPMLLEENGHVDKNHMILKMDIEGAEWEAFANLPDKYLEQFDQIVLEMHDLDKVENFEIMEKVFIKLNRYHQLVHVHGNNCSGYIMAEGKVMPCALECSYVNKNISDFKNNTNTYPNELDSPNNINIPDIYLGKWGR